MDGDVLFLVGTLVRILFAVSVKGDDRCGEGVYEAVLSAIFAMPRFAHVYGINTAGEHASVLHLGMTPLRLLNLICVKYYFSKLYVSERRDA